MTPTVLTSLAPGDLFVHDKTGQTHLIGHSVVRGAYGCGCCSDDDSLPFAKQFVGAMPSTTA